jgi:hypothetical protein
MAISTQEMGYRLIDKEERWNWILGLGSWSCREKENQYMWVYRVEGRCLGKKRVGLGMEDEKRQVQQVAMKVKRSEFRGSWAGLGTGESFDRV